MRLGVISDTHGSAAAWENVWDNGLKDCEIIIHSGDVLYHGPRNPLPEGHNPKILAELINKCSKRVLIAKGNCDASIDQVMLDYPIQEPAVSLILPDLNVFIHHGDLLYGEDLARFVRTADAKIVVSGHTHVRHLYSEGGIVYLNPGSAALPKNDDATPSFAIIDRNEIKLLNARDGSIMECTSVRI